jgi:hypothetical protein
MVEKINDGENSTYLKNIDPYKRAIHIHGRMKQNLVEYAKHYSCGNIEISGGSEFTRKIDYSRRDFSRHW